MLWSETFFSLTLPPSNKAARVPIHTEIQLQPLAF